MDDAISRQAVLKLLATMPPEDATTKALLMQSVKQMKSAQPSGPDNLVKDSQGLVKDLVNDTISRQAAIDAIFGRSHEIIKMRIGNLPSAQPERRKGRWRKGVCECGYDWAKDAPISSVPNFCPQCGADMREVSE